MTPGEQIGPYVIEALLGEGGMGEVYRARDTRLDRTVALKISKSEFGERFISEAKAIAAFNHPNICTLFDVGPNYLVMEHIEGTPLKGPLSAEKAVAYAGQILDALDAAHRKGFTHRDLKPANILVTKQGIKLLDFGLAKQKALLGQSDATLTQALTGAGQIVGTLQYMSPEQLQGKEADARSDLFAFGCVLYEMLSGKRAFEGASAASVIAAILEREPVPLNLHPPLGRVIKTCLEKDPDRRFQNALDLKRNLAWAMEQQPVSVAKANRWPWAVVAAVVITAMGTWAVMRSSKAPDDEQAVRFQLAPPEGGRFDQASIAVSPDGRMLAYAAIVQGKRGLWVRALDGSAARPLPGTGGASQPFWSPDARSIGYFANGKLWRIDLTRGEPLAICDAAGGLRGGSWGPDGTIVISIFPNPLSRVSASGGPPTPLTELNATREETYHSWPQILPGGRVILFLVVSKKPEHTGVYAARLDRPSEHIRLLANDSNAVYSAGHLLWRRGSTLVAQRFDLDRLQLTGDPRSVTDPVGNGTLRQIALAASSAGVLLYGSWSPVSRFIWMDRSGRPVGTMGSPGSYSGFALSKDGRRMVVSRKRGDSGADLWTVDLERDAWSRLTFAPAYSDAPIWSPDGRTILFYTGNPNSLFRSDSSGGGIPLRVTESLNAQLAGDWSLAGKSVLYEELSPGANRDLWVLPVTPDGNPAPGTKPRPYLQTPFNERNGRFSPEPNPRWVAYASDESGRYEIYVQSYPEPKGKFLISSGGGRYPAWGLTGRELFYVSPDNQLMAVKLKGDAESVTPSSPASMFGIGEEDGGINTPFAVAPDGQRFLLRVPANPAAQPLELIVNWPALLKKGGTTE